MRYLLSYADFIERWLLHVGRVAGWLLIANTVVIVIDVVTRKIGWQLPSLGSTRLQEMEWHFHMGLFILWIGAAYMRNAHVRIDLVSSRWSLRKRAWIELLSLMFFAIPYCLILIYFGADFAWESWINNESSESMTGLPWRWLPKMILEFGLVLLLLAISAIGCRLCAYIFGRDSMRNELKLPQIGAV